MKTINDVKTEYKNGCASRFRKDGLPKNKIVVRDTVVDNTYQSVKLVLEDVADITHLITDRWNKKSIVNMTDRIGYNGMTAEYFSNSKGGKRVYQAIKKSIDSGEPAKGRPDKDGKYPWYHGKVFCFAADLDDKTIKSGMIHFVNLTPQQTIGYTTPDERVCKRAKEIVSAISEKCELTKEQKAELMLEIRAVLKKSY